MGHVENIFEKGGSYFWITLRGRGLYGGIDIFREGWGGVSKSEGHHDSDFIC